MVAHDLRIKRISFGVAALKIARKSFGKSFTAHAWRDALRAEILQN